MQMEQEEVWEEAEGEVEWAEIAQVRGQEDFVFVQVVAQRHLIRSQRHAIL